MGRTKDSKTRYYIHNAKNLSTWDYHLSESSISRGIRYPAQESLWDCGPNSAGRALNMWSKISLSFSDYSHFKNHCPKTFGLPQTTSGYVTLGILHFLTFGISSIVATLIDKTESDEQISVGPTPGSLVEYINDNIEGEGKAYFSQNDYFSDVMHKIKNDLYENDPVIALIAYGPTEMHYVNVVAVDGDDIAILDTTDDLYYYKKNDFEDLLDCSSYLPHNFCLSKYNLIRFEAK